MWLDVFTTQHCLAASQTCWTSEVVTAYNRLKQGDEDAMREYYQQCVQELVLKGARAIGLVVHFHNRKTPLELQLREANWAWQFYTDKFEKLKARDGVRLQNMVYYRFAAVSNPRPSGRHGRRLHAA